MHTSTHLVRNPLYQQIRNILIDRIQSGMWSPGCQIPPEPALANEFGVSIGTIRHAVDTLVAEGIIDRHSGSGSFVKSYQRSGYWNVFQIYKDFSGKRRGSHWKLLAFESCDADKNIAARLNVSEGTKLIHTARQWLQGPEDVVSIDESYLLQSVFKKLTKEVFLSKFRPEDSLYRFFDRECGVVILNQKCTAHYEMLKGEAMRRLGLKKPFPTIRTDRVSMTFGHRAVEYRINRGRVDRTKLFFDLKQGE